MQEITYLMLKEHALINSKLIDIENSINNNEIKTEINKLKWLLEKHFFIEEKVIFKIYGMGDNEDILELIKQHKDILWIIKNIQNSLNLGKIKELKDILRMHTDIENKIFYPRLDNELDEKNKRIILERIDDVKI